MSGAQRGRLGVGAVIPVVCEARFDDDDDEHRDEQADLATERPSGDQGGDVDPDQRAVDADATCQPVTVSSCVRCHPSIIREGHRVWQSRD